jgi:PKD repeat protein
VPSKDAAGTYIVTITATNNVNVSTAKTITIVVEPINPTVSGVFNAVSPAPGPVVPELADSTGIAGPCSPGSYATLAGADLTPQKPQVSSGFRWVPLGRPQVLVNGYPAPLSPPPIR